MDSYSVALGIFDGVHLGHQRVIDKALSYRGLGLKTAVFTFSMEDMQYKQGREVHYILNNRSKLNMLKSMGVDSIVCPKFNEVHNISGESFAKDILHDQMRAKVVVCGNNFRFGKGASCNVTDLQRYGIQYGFNVEIVEPVLFHDGLISASLIRTLIANGNVTMANSLLGYEYYIYGEVVHGNAIGRTIGVPTINQTFAERQLIPMTGVYSSRVVIEGTEYPSMTNVGVKPTVSSENVPIAETHIIGYSGNLYGRTVKVSLKDYVRREKRFNSIRELQEAICNDIKTCLN